MSSTPSKNGARSAPSSGSETTPESGTPPAKRKKLIISPSLKAFESYDDALADFGSHVRTKTDQLGSDEHILKTELERLLKKKHEMEQEFQSLISNLNVAITNCTSERPNNLPAEETNPIPQEERSARCVSRFKNDHFTAICIALNQSISMIKSVINKKIDRSIYMEELSLSLKEKMIKLKKISERKIMELKDIGEIIKEAIEQNEELININVA